MLRMPTGCRLSNPKRRKAAKIHAFGRVRILLVTLTLPPGFLENLSELLQFVKDLWGSDNFFIKP